MRVLDHADLRSDASRLHLKGILGGLTALAASGLAACSLIHGGYRYELSIEIEAAGQRYSAQGVRELETRNEMSWPSTLQARRTRGEAFWIDVPGKPTLFVILNAHDGYSTQDWNPDLYLKVPRTEKVNGRTELTWDKIPFANLRPENLPALVYFDNIQDPSSGHFLNPLKMDAIYESGARITRASVERTRGPMPARIKKKLPWLNHELAKRRQNPMIWGSAGKYTFNTTQFYSEKW